ncbi:hypothetical protein KSP35_14295 [Aquihabitans sp. G128]|uniref:hypothetical protein n=1 Tax=Aquihabitans sp. G128 TaxID=2849779 RepID=UPI001C21E1CB|nr:hypothetical protein [Aquihabitans sp. G128]QXC59553.1 hypothetical protein KSP35_14295 [Aquihabitans sp. G128]
MQPSAGDGPDRRLAQRGAVAVVVVVVLLAGWWQTRDRSSSDRASPARSAAATASTASATSTTSPDPMCAPPSMAAMGGHHEGAATVSQVDGRWERSFGNPDPHVDTSSVPFDAPPTDAQRKAAASFVAAVRARATTKGWADPAAAQRDGYEPMQTCSSHWVDRRALFDDRVLDPDHPEFLVYAQTPEGSRLESVMFAAATADAHGPQPFGSLAVWHYHRADGGLCMERGMLVPDQTTGPDDCPAGTEPRQRTEEMLHVMLDPTGPAFATGM